jgi:membrane protein implicated in regulation of membrane protease activity
VSLDSLAFWWVVVAILAALIEISIPHFGVIFASAGALIAAVAATGGAPLPAQIIVFLFAFGLSFWLIRPRLITPSVGKGVPSRTEALVGKDGIVTHDIEPTVGAGRVNVGGEDWAARATTPLPAGTRIRVVGADGIVLEVTSA